MEADFKKLPDYIKTGIRRIIQNRLKYREWIERHKRSFTIYIEGYEILVAIIDDNYRIDKIKFPKK